MRCIRILRAAVLIALVFVLAQAQKLVYLPLQLPGQASVAIDEAKRTAYVVDLGKDKAGSEILFEGKPLLDRLSELKIAHVVFSCSHPHLDHMGGIRAFF